MYVCVTRFIKVSKLQNNASQFKVIVLCNYCTEALPSIHLLITFDSQFDEVNVG